MAVEGGREVQVGARREVVDDLEHRRALVERNGIVRFGRPGLPGQHRHRGRQVPRCLTVGERIHPVREHADPDARAVDAVPPAGLVGPVCDVALRRVDLPHYHGVRGGGSGRRRYALAARDRLVGGPDRLDCIELGQRLHGRKRQPGSDRAVLRHAVDHRSAQGIDACEDLRCHVGADVHRDGSVRFDLDRGQRQHRIADDRLAPFAPRRVQQVRAHLSLRWGPLSLLRHQRLDLSDECGRQLRFRTRLLLRTHRPNQQCGHSHRTERQDAPPTRP